MLAKKLIVGSVSMGSLALVLAVYGSTQLSNYLVNADRMTAADKRRKGASVTKVAGLTFVVLVADLLLLVAAFFAAASAQIIEPGMASADSTMLNITEQQAAAARSTALAAAAARSAAEDAARIVSAASVEWSKSLDEMRKQINDLRAPQPRPASRALLDSEWAQIQQAVGANHDGRKGVQTCQKLRDWQRAHGSAPTGLLSSEQVDQLIGPPPQKELRLDVKSCPRPGKPR